MRIYLVGPMTGQSGGDIKDWRSTVKSLISDADFVDPAVWDVDKKEWFHQKERPSEALRRRDHGRLVADRNKLLIKSSDLVFANLLGAKKASIGSVGELFWGNSFGKPVIVVREAVGNVHDHAMVNAIATRICNSIEEGCDVLKEFKVPYVA